VMYDMYSSRFYGEGHREYGAGGESRRRY